MLCCDKVLSEGHIEEWGEVHAVDGRPMAFHDALYFIIVTFRYIGLGLRSSVLSSHPTAKVAFCGLNISNLYSAVETLKCGTTGLCDNFTGSLVLGLTHTNAKLWSGCAKECRRSHVLGEILSPTFLALRNFCCTPRSVEWSLRCRYLRLELDVDVTLPWHMSGRKRREENINTTSAARSRPGC